jgi:hypothetical protein
MKLYLVHCGFYDNDVCDGVYESHVNFFVVAEGFEEARAKARLLPDFQKKRMHVDGVQEIAAVDGYRLQLTLDPTTNGRTILLNNKQRELAPKSGTNTASS